MINLFVDSQTVKFFWSIKIGVKNIQLVRNCILCTFCKKQRKAIKIQLLTLLYWSERRVKLWLLILLYWFEKRAGVELPVHLLDFLSCWYYRQQHKTSTYLKKKKRQNTGKHLSDFEHEHLCFHFLPICRSDLFICAVHFFTYNSN